MMELVVPFALKMRSSSVAVANNRLSVLGEAGFR